ncbi:hypothetical protein GYMLUDRAFT_243746 [Collybiopsis luxurians FD-317 M1]|uniref:Methyltransferase domain-containing protein n=1 Tax=Collybiopsis luxurians FD-317 M1 TaxID=944289 RepID=A0A0D0BZ01_9AGAR|nr:hypothetical protein GYMLUDRAFT_243746 [Collybiopsis luxurians FD-317 M1]
MTPLRLPPIELSDTAYRLAQAEAIYQKILKDRDQLIARYGPHPSDLDMFPPNKSPWPAYTVWDYFPAAFNCPHEVRRVGMMGDGGKWLCGLSRLVEKEDCIVYSVGLNRDCSFETDLLINTNHCKIYGYDYSVKGYSKNLPLTVRHRAEFHPYVLGGVDRPASGKEPAIYTLKSLMEMNGHQHIDVLKVDIEGWEFEAFTDILKHFVEKGQPLPFGQLQLEIHVWDKKFEEFLKWWEGLEEAGLRPFWTEPNLVYVNYAGSRKPELAEYSFLNIKGDNAFIRK